MVDADWLMHLAQARGEGPELAPQDQRAVEALAASRIEATIEDLHQDAHEAAEIYNGYVRDGRKIAVLALAGPNAAAQGFVLLLGTAQLSLTHREHRLHADLTVLDGFRRVTRALHRFEPLVDAFGSLLWRMDNALLLDNELIMKRLFEDLRRAAR